MGEDFRDWSGGYAGRFRTVDLYAEMGLFDEQELGV